MAVERAGTPEHVVDVYYRCEECQRPFVVAHDPTAMAQVALTDLDTRTLQRLAFYRWLYRGGTR
ncbi:MAG: hypothetical protein K6U88_16205 [Dehalococcoidia bacterium]|jgi:hypothetical protein|nr:hypothetical protein [Dehalococcoidia bacterium]